MSLVRSSLLIALFDVFHSHSLFLLERVFNIGGPKELLDPGELRLKVLGPSVPSSEYGWELNLIALGRPADEG